jgi:hypothetical protein
MVEVINLRTCKDWGKPGDVRIDRKTKWGNPYTMQTESDRDRVCNLYEVWLDKQLRQQKLNLKELKNAQRLGCWCSPKRCHGDYLKRKIEDYQIYAQQILIFTTNAGDKNETTNR